MHAPITRTFANYTLSDDPARLDLAAMHRYLQGAYWSQGLPLEVLERAVQGSLCIGAYEERGTQVGLARFISDFATFCYVCDVYVLRGTAAAAWRARCWRWRSHIRACRDCGAGTSSPATRTRCTATADSPRSRSLKGTWNARALTSTGSAERAARRRARPPQPHLKVFATPATKPRRGPAANARAAGASRDRADSGSPGASAASVCRFRTPMPPRRRTHGAGRTAGRLLPRRCHCGSGRSGRTR